MTETDKPALPRGVGSIQKRRRAWWMIYRDVEGKTIVESSHTGDAAAATRMLAQRALVALRARVALLEGLADETPPRQETRPGGDQRR